MILEYKIVSDEFAYYDVSSGGAKITTYLEESVKEHLLDGWKLHGSVFVNWFSDNYIGNGSCHFMRHQPMVRKKTNVIHLKKQLPPKNKPA